MHRVRINDNRNIKQYIKYHNVFFFFFYSPSIRERRGICTKRGQHCNDFVILALKNISACRIQKKNKNLITFFFLVFSGQYSKTRSKYKTVSRRYRYNNICYTQSLCVHDNNTISIIVTRNYYYYVIIQVDANLKCPYVIIFVCC